MSVTDANLHNASFQRIFFADTSPAENLTDLNEAYVARRHKPRPALGRVGPSISESAPVCPSPPRPVRAAEPVRVCPARQPELARVNLSLFKSGRACPSWPEPFQISSYYYQPTSTVRAGGRPVPASAGQCRPGLGLPGPPRPSLSLTIAAEAADAAAALRTGTTCSGAGNLALLASFPIDSKTRRTAQRPSESVWPVLATERSEGGSDACSKSTQTGLQDSE